MSTEAFQLPLALLHLVPIVSGVGDIVAPYRCNGQWERSWCPCDGVKQMAEGEERAR